MSQYADTVAFAVQAAAADLPADVAAMVAPSVTVTAGPVAVGVAAGSALGAAPSRPRVELLLHRTDGPAVSPAPPCGGRHRRRARTS